MTGDLLQCYNRGCGKKYTVSENTDTSCTHHPGEPVFHDSYKIWSCCDKKSIDFTVFLDMKGCKVSKHSNIKPDVKQKSQTIEIESKSQPVRVPYEPIERPPSNIPLGNLRLEIGASLKPQLEQLMSNIEKSDIIQDEVLTVGTSCKNSGCKGVYESQESNSEVCFYHTGVPVFHEGMKFWSCCNRRTTDFEMFLAQEGCVQGRHCWLKPIRNLANEDRLRACRFDWFQTSSNVVISIYSKLPLPAFSVVKSNQVRLHALITFGADRKVFENIFELFGVIDVENSYVNYLASKTEINLKKAEPVHWDKLIYIGPKE